MKKALLTTALGLSLAVPMVEASPITSVRIDANGIMGSGLTTGDTNYNNLVTDVFDYFTLADFSPVSTYIDIDDNGVTTGDIVNDVATDVMVTGLNPLAYPDNLGGFNSSWGLSASWDFSGIAGVDTIDTGTGDVNVYGGAFDTGSMTLSFINGSTITEILKADITPFAQENGIVSWNDTEGYAESVVTFYASIVSVYEGIIFTDDGIDLHTLIKTVDSGLAIGGNITKVDETPQLSKVATYDNSGALLTPAEYSRSTKLTSVDISVVPEPTSIAIMGLGLLGLAAARRRKS